MKIILIILLTFIFSSNLYAEFRMERVICTTKKTSNCGAYIYNSRTGEVYFCDSGECKEVKTPIEIFIEEEIEAEAEEQLLIPKKPKKKESKIPKKPKKKESKIPKKPEKKSDKCDKDSKIPKKGCS